MNPQLKSIDVQAPCPCSSGLVYKVITTTAALAAVVHFDVVAVIIAFRATI